MLKPYLYFNTLNKSTIMILGLIMVFVIGWVDYLTGTEVSFSIFYLIPISFVAYHGYKSQAVFIAVLSAVIWLTADVSEISRYSNQSIPYWNGLVRFGFFIIVVYLIVTIKQLTDELEENVRIRTADLTKEVFSHKQTVRELERKSEKLSQLAKRVQTLKETENTKIARDIHDELGQAMTAIKIDIFWLSKKYSNDSRLVENLMSITNTVDEAIKSIRSISTRLRPRLLDELGLIPAIEWQLKDFHAKTGIDITLFSPGEDIKVRSSVSNAIFRIFQEAITNVARHSKASKVNVSIDANCNGNFKMDITDDGVGLPKDYFNKDHSLGILGMKERAQIVKGKVELSNPNHGGTKVSVCIPLEKNHNNHD